MAMIKVCDRSGAKITPSISGDQRIIFEGSVWSLLVHTRAMDLCESCARELREGYMVCFLDGDTENFDLDNLCAINRQTSARLAVNGWWSDDRELTRTGVMWCELQDAINRRRTNDETD